MALWLVRAGRHGEREMFAIENDVVLIGWERKGDLGAIESREALLEALKAAYPEHELQRLRNWAGQLWAFSHRIQVGDWVALPLKGRSAVAFGEVVGPYEYRPDNPEDARHIRPVKWINTDVARSSIDQDILYSLGAFMTVCQIQRNDAEARLKALVSGGRYDGPGLVADGGEEEPVVNLEEFARDQIRTHISQKYRGHELARLVGALLEAQGYHSRVSSHGADGGVDIIAGKGAMGFDHPRLVVQVKSSDTPVDVSVLRELQGIMKGFGAEQGLLVSWGGFKSSVVSEARRLFFEIRLWDADDVVDTVVDQYSRLPDDMQAELPLKRLWALVVEE